jgi:peptide alpha-N-acetyltransferase
MRIVKLFLRDGERMMSLYDLQGARRRWGSGGAVGNACVDALARAVMWFEVSAAEMHMRKQEFGLALKLLHHVQAHLDDIVEDQADFHAYSIRKGPLRAYVEMIRFIDSAPSFRHLVTASKRLVQVRRRAGARARARVGAMRGRRGRGMNDNSAMPSPSRASAASVAEKTCTSV